MKTLAAISAQEQTEAMLAQAIAYLTRLNERKALVFKVLASAEQAELTMKLRKDLFGEYKGQPERYAADLAELKRKLARRERPAIKRQRWN